MTNELEMAGAILGIGRRYLVPLPAILRLLNGDR